MKVQVSINDSYELNMKKLYQSVLRWFKNNNPNNIDFNELSNKIDWLKSLPFIALNLSCLLVFLVGVSKIAIIVSLLFCYLRIFAIGAFYHRYFSHRAYKTSRFCQFVFAVLGASAVQRGPLWWASHHRNHHARADKISDPHSPLQHGFFWSHMGWFLSEKNYFYSNENIRDLLRYPELVFLERYDALVPGICIVLMFALGKWLESFPNLNTNAWQILVWGFSISTILLFHLTVSINSLAHKYGKKVYSTKDESRNSLILALLTFGEGWHNNHHHYPSSARQGFYFWQIDITYYLLRLLEKIGIIWDLRPVPKEILKGK